MKAFLIIRTNSLLSGLFELCLSEFQVLCFVIWVWWVARQFSSIINQDFKSSASLRPDAIIEIIAKNF